MKASEFTEKAMQMAREQREQEAVAYASEHDASDYIPEPKKHSVNLYLSENDLKQLNRLMDLGISKSREAITRCKRFPTDSLRSKETIERHEGIIEHIESLRNHLTEESQW